MSVIPLSLSSLSIRERMLTSPCEALQKLCMLQAELEQAWESYDALQQMATYASLVVGEEDPVTVDFFKQCKDKMKSQSQQPVSHPESQISLGNGCNQMHSHSAKGFSVKDSPFVKELDFELQSIGLHRQQYFGGAFIGNHVRKALKVL